MKMRASGLALVLMATAAGGCSLVLGFDKDYHALGSGGSGGGSGSGGSGGGESPDVTGSVNTIYLLPDGGTNTVGVDLSQGAAIQALSPQPGGAFTVIDGEGHADGTFIIHDVPPGPYYLRRSSSYHWLTGRHPRFDIYRIDRADVKPISQMTPVTVSLTGLLPWDPATHSAVLDSLTADASRGLGLMTSAGDTTLNETFDWGVVSSPNILVPSDSTYLIQTVPQSSKGHGYAAAVRFAGVSGLAMEDGKPLQISAALVATQRHTTVNWDLPTVEAYAKFTNPRVEAISHELQIYAQPTFEHGYLAFLSLLDFAPPAGSSAIFGLPLSYVDTGLDEAYWAETSFSVPFQLPGSTLPTYLPASLTRIDTKAAFEQQSTTVLLSQPVTPKIDGRSLFLDQSPASTTPTVTWTAPVKGHADYYTVRIRRLYKDAKGATRTEKGTLAYMATDGTSLTVPPGILLPGEVYVIYITAVTAPGVDFQNAPYSYGLKEISSEVISGMLSIPPSDVMCAQGSCVVPSDCAPPSNDCLEATCYLGCCGAASKSAGSTCNTSGGKICDGKGTCVECWINGDCQSPNICGADYKCAPQPSCQGLPATCGDNEGCCASPLVTGGTYNRSNDPASPATVSDFRLDRFEVTVGRFRAFVNAWVGGWRPAMGAGKHRHLPSGGLNIWYDPTAQEPGWDTAWNTYLASSKATWDANLACPFMPTWTPSAGANENLPLNCLTWYDAYAFCIWDGGFLPSEAEWNYAAAAGSEQRQYPWGSAPPDPTLEVFDCTGDGSMAGMCSAADILKVGAKSPKGDGRYSQADLAGGVGEWTLDSYESYGPECTDCASTEAGASDRVTRGGSWDQDASFQSSDLRAAFNAISRDYGKGVRCARTP